MRLELDTPTGTAWADLDMPDADRPDADRPDADLRGVGAPRSARALLLLGHGAGGTVDAPDLIAVRDAALALGIAVARITQPYRVLGRRAPAAADRLDEAWTAVTAQLAVRAEFTDVPVVHAGRSSGARVACRCAAATGAAAVIALAFPVHPPGRPEKSRSDELRAVACPLLVVQGRSDAFGQPDAAMFDRPGRELASVEGTHSLGRDTNAVARAVTGFLERWLTYRGSTQSVAIAATFAPVRRMSSAGATSSCNPRRPAEQ